MRWAELGLFLVPFALFALWRFAAVIARPALVWGAVALVLLFAAGTVYLAFSHREAPGDVYVPAHIADGKIVPGHGVPRGSTAAR
jgi:hypothetical protein